ncbi:Aspartic proteinase nepenthesin-2-like protein [Drosera capensis]
MVTPNLPYAYFKRSIPTISISGHDLNSNKLSFRTTIKHIDAGKNLTRSELIKRAVERGNHRLEALKSRLTAGTSPSAGALVQPGNGEYLMNLGIGTPPTYFSAIMDTGSDLIWTQCAPCLLCFSQPTAIFNPAKSSSYSKLSCTSKFCEALPSYACDKKNTCSYLYQYADYSYTEGSLASETFTFGTSKKGTSKVRNVAFGCGDINQGFGEGDGAGLVGLGRGPLSLISQLDEPQFSYCLTPMLESETSSLLLGSSANSLPYGPIRTTSLVKNPLQPSFYYMSLLGIIIGKTRLSIPPKTFALNADGTGGVIVDSGTTLFYLPTSAFNLVAAELAKEIKLEQVNLYNETGLTPCWKVPSKRTYSFPKFILHLNGTYIELFSENYLLEAYTGIQCLALAPSDSFTIFGNVAQQGYLVRYDLGGEKLSFVPTNCKGQ